MARVFKPKPNSTNFYIEYVDANGKTRREAVGQSEEAAGLILADKLRDVALEKAGHAPIRKEPKLSELAFEYLKHVEARVAENTFASKRTAIYRFIKYFKVDPRPSTITTKIVSEHLDKLVKDGLMNDSANIHLSHIRSMLEWGHGSGELPTPCPGALTKPLPASKKKARPRRALTPEEIKAIQNEATGEMKMAVLFALYAGLRIDEIGLIEWRDIDLGRGTIHIRDEIAKSGEALLPLHPAIAKCLPERTGPYDKIVKVPGNAYRPLYRLLEKAGVERKNEHGVIDWHAFRHTYLTMAAINGGEKSVKELQMLARHANPSTTLKIYVHTDVNRMRDLLGTVPDFGD